MLKNSPFNPWSISIHSVTAPDRKPFIVIDALPKSTARLAWMAPCQGLGGRLAGMVHRGRNPSTPKLSNRFNGQAVARSIPSSGVLAPKRPGDLQRADAPPVASRLSRKGLSLIAGFPGPMPLPAPPRQVVAAAHTATRTGKPDSVRGDQRRRPTITATPLPTLMAPPCDAMLILESVAIAIGAGALSRMPAR